MKHFSLSIALFLSFFFSNAQSQWQFIDCFTHPSMDANGGSAGFNLNSAQLQFDNFGVPWVGVGVQGSQTVFLGRPINGTWEFINVPVPDMGMFTSHGVLNQFVFDDTNVPWAIVSDELSMNSLVRVTEQSIVNIPNTENIHSIYKFPNDPFIYVSKANGLYRLNTSSPYQMTEIYGENAFRLERTSNGSLIILNYDQPNVLTVMSESGNLQDYTLNGVDVSSDIVSMTLASDGAVWLYFKNISQILLYRYDFQN
jgi:hypothetical protein